MRDCLDCLHAKRDPERGRIVCKQKLWTRDGQAVSFVNIEALSADTQMRSIAKICPAFDDSGDEGNAQ